MKESYRECDFSEDIELMNLTYKMNTGNFLDYENELPLENNEINSIQTTQPKFGL